MANFDKSSIYESIFTFKTTKILNLSVLKLHRYRVSQQNLSLIEFLAVPTLTLVFIYYSPIIILLLFLRIQSSQTITSHP